MTRRPKPFVQKAHGEAKRLGAVAVVEVPRPSELLPASPDTGGPLLPHEQRDSGGRFVRGNSWAARARRRVGNTTFGHLAAHPDFAPFIGWGRSYAERRRRELCALHGGRLSAGVGVLIETAALTLAASRYLFAKGSETIDAGMLKQASLLGADARQNELAAWELAAREAAARGKSGPKAIDLFTVAEPEPEVVALVKRKAKPPEVTE